jgi:hypothetical protein
LVRSCGSDDIIGVQELGLMESSVEVLCVEELFHFW